MTSPPPFLTTSRAILILLFSSSSRLGRCKRRNKLPLNTKHQTPNPKPRIGKRQQIPKTRNPSWIRNQQITVQTHIEDPGCYNSLKSPKPDTPLKQEPRKAGSDPPNFHSTLHPPTHSPTHRLIFPAPQPPIPFTWGRIQ